MVGICRVRQIVRDRVRRVRRVRAEGFISSAAIARRGNQKFYIVRRRWRFDVMLRSQSRADHRGVRSRDAKVLATKINSATFTVTCDLAPGYANFRA
jgi:hypothetical protein